MGIRLYAICMFAELIRDQQDTDSDAADSSHFPVGGGSAWPSDAAVWKVGDFDSAASADAGDRVPDGNFMLQGAADAHSAPAPGADPSCEQPGLGALSYSALEDRLVELVAERNRVEGEYLEVLGELTSRHGTQAAAYVLRDQTRMNGTQARTESRLAESLREHDLAGTLDAMRSGEIHMAHAKVIARESPKKHRRSEASFLGLARAYPSDTLARHTLAYESQQVYADLAAEAAAGNLDPVDAELALQRHQRRASLRCGDDGMWDLRGRFDFLTGRQLSITLQAAVRAARRNADSAAAARNSRTADDPAAGDAAAGDPAGGGPASGGDVGDQVPAPTTAQLTADALAGLICGTQSSRRSNAGLVIVADYDIANDRLANPRLDDGTPISPSILADLTLEPLPGSARNGRLDCPATPQPHTAEQTATYAVAAKVLPAVFSADWSQLALGTARNANDAQRLILALRDGGCISCELTPEHTEAHHIDYHEHGGPTEVPNLASLCRPCHKSLHNHQRQIDIPPDGRPRLRPPQPTGTGPPEPGDIVPPSSNAIISTGEPSQQPATESDP